MSETKPMTEEEKKFFDKYGRLPTPSTLLSKRDKKYFDSADWAKGQQTDAKEVKQPETK
ncbi:hypothetical protein DDB_G0273119 [Dictyostelium discoideum AX4]|uniref:Uncharacterized protein n=1 Tax=Dictyostelium discoideum TaxID=44689 RepID=Q556S3_DICDI|nr:hypothetical protein DDB_G0273863 [Dictyostelium discoideum AX4]XP_644703.1 hypothetical protein DDB_G0273119 [Dictyostelium discoideum AX4]EAL70622.1 hypothetical protein DDB_G0273863 [Dictyostelium discoideum AX4]EAL70777.1 hypothetical protein DDB_G0273119 [Dictyostelium discoideum AX4]|eukprot:XP_644548.1 hypothetical protein DDB_G0273863 [Dictyostelium discoideum AX4]